MGTKKTLRWIKLKKTGYSGALWNPGEPGEAREELLEDVKFDGTSKAELNRQFGKVYSLGLNYVQEGEKAVPFKASAKTPWSTATPDQPCYQKNPGQPTTFAL